MALTIHPSDYMGKLVDYCMMKIYSLIKIKETNQTWSEEDDFVMQKPKLQIQVRTVNKNFDFDDCNIKYFHSHWDNFKEVDWDKYKSALQIHWTLR